MPASQRDHERSTGRFHAAHSLLAAAADRDINDSNTGASKVVWGAAIGEYWNCQPTIPEAHVARNMLWGKMNALKELGDSIWTENWHYGRILNIRTLPMSTFDSLATSQIERQLDRGKTRVSLTFPIRIRSETDWNS